MSDKAPQPDNNKPDDAGEDISWQAQKSAMTRDRILDAAIDCFINLGYTNVTTAKVASTAGVSRGAMLHHFPSKTELIQAAVEYLHGKLLEDYSERVRKIPKSKKGGQRRRAGAAKDMLEHVPAQQCHGVHKERHIGSKQSDNAAKACRLCGKQHQNEQPDIARCWCVACA